MNHVEVTLPKIDHYPLTCLLHAPIKRAFENYTFTLFNKPIPYNNIMPKDPVPCVSVFTKWFQFIWLIEMCKGGVHPYTKKIQKPKPIVYSFTVKSRISSQEGMCNHNQNL